MSIRFQRRIADITQKELAAGIGVERSTVAKWETKIIIPSDEKLNKVASFLGCTVDELLKEENKNEKQKNLCKS